MPDTGYAHGYPWEKPTISKRTNIDDPWQPIHEIAAGSLYDHDTQEGTGLFAPLDRDELLQLGIDPDDG